MSYRILTAVGGVIVAFVLQLGGAGVASAATVSPSGPGMTYSLLGVPGCC